MTTSAAKTLMFAAVSTAAGITPVAWPNITFESDDPHYRAFDMPGEKYPFGIKTTDIQSGILQVSCCVRSGVGEVAAATMADTILAAFPRHRILVSGATKVMIDKAAWASRGFDVGDGWYMIPVSIPYKIIT